MQFRDELSVITGEVKTLKLQITREEIRLEELRKQKAAILKVCAKQGIADPDQLAGVIAKKQHQLSSLLDTISGELGQITQKRDAVFENLETRTE